MICVRKPCEFNRVWTCSMPSRLCVFLRENDYRKHFSLEVSIHAPAFPLSLFGAGLPLQVIGSRGATGRAAQEFDTTPFFGGQILDRFLRGSRWPKGSILEVKMWVNFNKNVTKNASEIR